MMADTTIGHSRRTVQALSGSTTVPADKSISQRAAILGALARGSTQIGNYSDCADATSTLNAVANAGAAIERRGADVAVTGIADVSSITGTVDMGKSGTGLRLLTGALSASGCNVTLSGHPQLLARPMSRVATPLREMGAEITLADGEHAPITIRASHLHGITYELPVASAQIKSALLLAGLRAEGPTTVIEPRVTRDHTERILQAMGISVQVSGEGPRQVRVEPGELQPLSITVPGDLSAAVFIIAAATLVPGSDVVISNVGINPTRSRVLDILRAMGADIEIEPISTAAVEPAANLRVRHAPLRGITLQPEDVPALIDELPVLSLIATQAEGETSFTEAAELRIKESDRLSGIATGLRGLGAQIDENPDGLTINGPTPLHGAQCDSLGDHRLAMAFSIADLCTTDEVVVAGMDSVDDSFPGFVETLRSLGANL
jgi:3-phosphoshikimate 1-carboxyvinyltransferase